MSREIIEALRQIEKEKGIAFETLVDALEDALLSAYKKTPDAVEHAKVEIDPETGDMRVFQLIFPDHIDVEALKVLERIEDARREHETRRSTSRASTRARSSASTSPPTTSAASPRRPPSRSSCSGSARPSAT